MSITDKIIQDNPTKYDILLEARILSKVLQMKIDQYNSLQNQYNNLLQIQNNTGGKWTDQVNMFLATSPEYWKFLGKTDKLNGNNTFPKNTKFAKVKFLKISNQLELNKGITLTMFFLKINHDTEIVIQNKTKTRTTFYLY